MRRSRAFTLVELLVVIGIIALLISVLMPALSNARRQANRVKCLSNLRQIGQAFMLYERQFKGAWPVVYHHQTGGGVQPPLYPAGHFDRSWMDFIAPYMVGVKSISTPEDVAAARQQYTQMQCPAWERGVTGNVAQGDPYYMGQPIPGEPTVLIGYGMHYHPNWYEIYDPLSPNPALRNPNNWGTAVNTAPAITRDGPKGRYVKAHIWGRRGSERGLIADSDASIIFTLYAFRRSQVMFQPFLRPGPNGLGFNEYVNFTVDGLRHVKPPQDFSALTRKRSIDIVGMNMLFCDGHASPVSVAQAWNAIHNPGEDRTRIWP